MKRHIKPIAGKVVPHKVSPPFMLLLTLIGMLHMFGGDEELVI